jgi:glyoxylase-like metal-dependent hydrolase (beta-lactamase superfamily II)
VPVQRDDPSVRWYEPGVFTVVPGIYRIPLPLHDELRAVNVYAIEGDDGFTLIDSGQVMAEARRQLEVSLKELGAGLADVRQFLVTHVHRDHYTQAVAVRRELGTRVSLGAGEQASLKVMADPAVPAYHQQLTDLHRNGASEVADRVRPLLAEETVPHTAWEPPDDWVEPGTHLAAGRRRLEARATPGHTQGHMVYHERQDGLLFAGDHVLPHITPSIGLEPAPGGSPLADYLGSLRDVRTLPDARLLPAHGPLAASSHARIDELLGHHDTRLQAVATAIERGARTAFDVSGVLLWTRRDRPFRSLAPFHQMLAVIETAYHLHLLVAQARLVPGEADGITYYAVADERWLDPGWSEASRLSRLCQA